MRRMSMLNLAFIEKIAEERIREAQEKGEFDNLPGAGLPLDLDDDAGVPEELRMAWRVLKNAGCLPPEIEAGREITNALELLENMTDEAERYRQMQRLNLMVTRMNMSRRRPVFLEAEQFYYDKIVTRVPVTKKPGKEPA
jgi:hypothetical protein